MDGRAAPMRRDASDPGAFEALLRSLHPERERAAERYEEVRQLLCRFFIWRKARWPEEMADEVIDRVARRLAGGETIRAADVGRYFMGVARYVLREDWRHDPVRKRERNIGVMAERIPARLPATETDQETRFDCLERCLSELGDGGELVLRYYEGEGTARMEARRNLAAELGVSAGSLRIRLYRLRERLEDCLRECLHARLAGVSPSEEGGRE